MEDTEKNFAAWLQSLKEGPELLYNSEELERALETYGMLDEYGIYYKDFLEYIK